MNSQIALDDILDGSSYTILLGEKLIEDQSLGWASGTRATLRNGSELQSYHYQTGIRSQFNGPLTPVDVGGFGSEHPGTVNFAMADGSVKSISYLITPTILNHLGNRRDGTMIADLRRL